MARRAAGRPRPLAWRRMRRDVALDRLKREAQARYRTLRPPPRGGGQPAPPVAPLGVLLYQNPPKVVMRCPAGVGIRARHVSSDPPGGMPCATHPLPRCVYIPVYPHPRYPCSALEFARLGAVAYEFGPGPYRGRRPYFVLHGPVAACDLACWGVQHGRLSSWQQLHLVAVPL